MGKDVEGQFGCKFLFLGGYGKPQDSSDDFQDMAWEIRVIRRLFLPNIIGRE